MVGGVLLISGELSPRDQMCGSKEVADDSSKDEKDGATTDVSEISARLVCLPSFKGVEVNGTLLKVESKD